MDYNRFVDDMTKVAGNTVTSMLELKKELEVFLGKRLESMIKNLDVVKRDEFNALKKGAQQSRKTQDALEKRVAQIEKQLGIKPPVAQKKAKAKPAAAKKATQKTQSKTAGKSRGKK